MSTNSTSTESTFVGTILLALFLVLFTPYVLMLLLGSLALETGWPTAIGYRATFVLNLVFRILFRSRSGK